MFDMRSPCKMQKNGGALQKEMWVVEQNMCKNLSYAKRMHIKKGWHHFF